MENNKLGAAVVNYACPICGKQVDSAIILNSRLSVTAANKIKEFHNKTVGYSDNACEECSKHKDEGIYLIEIDNSKSDMKCMETMYRTGVIAFVKNDSDFVKNVTKNNPKFILSTKNDVKFMFVDKGIIER